MTTRFPREARKNDPTGWTVVQDNLRILRDAFDKYVAGVVPYVPPPGPITGQVDATGAATRGTGFTPSRTGTGVFVVTFTSVFSVVPTVLVTLAPTSTNTRVIRVSAVSVSAFTVQIVNTSGVAQDEPFHFVATPTV